MAARLVRFCTLCLTVFAIGARVIVAAEFDPSEKSPPLPSIMNREQESFLSNVVPNEFQQVQDSMKQSQGILNVGLAKAIVGMTRSAKEKLTDVSDSATSTEKDRLLATNAYRASWQVAIEFFKASKDVAAKELIRDDWEAGLKGGKFEDIQAFVLAEHWVPEFFSDNMASLLEQREDSDFLRSIAYMIAHNGNDAQVAVVKKRIGTLRDPGAQQMLANALSWREYWKSGITSNPGPAALSPSLKH